MGRLPILLAIVGCYRSGPASVILEQPVLRFQGSLGEALPPQRVLVPMGTGVRWHAEHDAEWLTLSPPAGAGATSVTVSVDTLAIHPGVHEVVVAVLPEDPDRPPFAFLVELTLSGADWIALPGPYGGTVTALAVDPSDPDRILAGAQGTLWESGDGGSTFQKSDNGPPDTGDIRDLKLAPSGRGHVATQGAGVWSTTDYGQTWTATALTDEARRLAIEPGNTLEVLAIGGGQMWHTTNGHDFALVTLPGPVYSAAPLANGGWLVGGDTGTVYELDAALAPLATSLIGVTNEVAELLELDSGRWLAVEAWQNAISLSDDRGTTWSRSTALTPIGSRARMHVHQAEVWLATPHGVWRSHDQGTSFERVATPGRVGCTNALASLDTAVLIGHCTAGVLRSETNDLTPAALIAHAIRPLVWASATNEVFGLTSIGHHFRWSDGGGFSGAAGDGYQWDDQRSLAVDPRNPHVRWVAGRWGHAAVQRTSDDGASWQELDNGLGGDAVTVALSPDAPDVLWVASRPADGGIFRTMDNGASFQQVLADDCGRVVPLSRDRAVIECRVDVDNDYLSHIDASSGVRTDLPGAAYPNNENPLLARTADGAFFCGRYGTGLMRSTDGTTLTPIGLTDVLHTAVVLLGDGRLLVGTEDGLFLGNVGDWTRVGPDYAIESLAHDHARERVFVGTTSHGLHIYAP